MSTHSSGWYEIRLRGRLDSRWATRFDALTLTTTSDGTTLIQGHLPDQAALYGLLHQLGDLGLPLISVTEVDGDPLLSARRPTATRPTSTFRSRRLP